MPSAAWHRVARVALVIVITLPVVASLLAVLLPAIGIFPALGGTSLSLDPARQALAIPGLTRAVLLSLGTALAATALALLGSFAILVMIHGTRAGGWIGRICGPIIAVPPSAVAIGILLLLAPSGWLMRLASPWLTGFDRPPSFALVPDPQGVALVFALLAKEMPFVLLVSLAALATLPAGRLIRTGQSLGYSHSTSWIYLVLPLVYRRIRLPLAAVMIFALSVVDMPRLLGPSLPPPLAVLAVEGFEHADLARRFPAAFAACLQIAVTVLALMIWRVGEWGVSALLARMRRGGHRARLAGIILAPIAVLAILPPLAAIAGLISAAIWSVAASWFFPAAWPAGLSLKSWARIDSLVPALASSLVIALLASVLAVVAVLLVVPLTRNRARSVLRISVYAPLLIPQVSFVLGLQMMLTWLWLDGSWLAMIWVHSLFIIPFAWLIIAPADANLDRRHLTVAASLGAGPAARYLKVALPMLSPAITTALFVGVAVSVALYLPSLFAGGGRITTITLEAVALASGGSWQMAGVATMLQLVIPLVIFLLLRSWQARTYGRFAGMKAGGLQ